jgi:hypothetical protein
MPGTKLWVSQQQSCSVVDYGSRASSLGGSARCASRLFLSPKSRVCYNKTMSPHRLTLEIPAPKTRLDLIICLGSPLNKDQELTWQCQARVEEAALLFQQHQESKLLLTGGNSHNPPQTLTSESEAMRKYLIAKYQVDRTRLLLETESTSIVEQLCVIKHELIAPEGLKNICLVSDELHIRRAAMIFDLIFGDGCALFTQGAVMNLSGPYLEALSRLEQQSCEHDRQTYINVERGDDQLVLQLDRQARTKAVPAPIISSITK